MSIALPIQLIAGDTANYPCRITGGEISQAIFALKIKLADGYRYTAKEGPDRIINTDTGYEFILSGPSSELPENMSVVDINSGHADIYINIVEDSPTPGEMSHNITFNMPAKFTECFGSGKYTYDISVRQTENDRYTPIYLNAFNVFPKTNIIINESLT